MSYGLHYSDALAGRVFSQAVTPLGLALPIYTATAVCTTAICGMPIWNPPNSQVNVELISAGFNWASGTAAFSAIGLMALPLSALSASELCTAFVDTTPQNGNLLFGNKTKVKSSNGAGAVTVTAGTADAPTSAAPGWVDSLASMNLEANTGTAHGTTVAEVWFNGTINIPPGVMIYFAGTKASVALFAGKVKWKETSITR